MYEFDQRPSTKISDDSGPVLGQIRASECAVLVGRNNCGKSYLLKMLAQQWGDNASYLGPARYQNFQVLSPYSPNRDRLNNKRNQQRQHLQSAQTTNQDNSPLNLQQAIAELSDDKRAVLAKMVKELLGAGLEWLQTIPNNSMSQRYVSYGGHNVSYTSSGARLIMTLLTSLLDSDFDTFLIDEPELGISPEAQGVLADFLFDQTKRALYFPHIKTLVFATHSTIFLDRARVANNYSVTKQGDVISIEQIQTQAEFNNVHFFLLGNRFETLFLPSAIILVEGKSDDAFVQRVVSLRFPNAQISVIPAHSDSRIKEVLNIARGLFSDLQRSPYRDRIFIILDSVHSASLPSQLTGMGIPAENVIVWPDNGIEFCYPPTLVDKFFGVGAKLTANGDVVSRNGVSYSKADLAAKISASLARDTPMHPSFENLFLTPLAKVAS